ncbi:MAG TPA: TolC family protein, partial [Novosphingobium sp.]|nr:TolC family protein [Novosphingobium sp.]
ARAFMRWNIFSGGINQAKYEEMVRRTSEARFRLHQVSREAEEDVRTAWNALRAQTRITGELETQSKVSDDLLLSYRSQFNVGRRSLLDVLDAQNTRYSVQTRLETARFSQIFAQYQTLAATNRFLTALDVAPGAGSGEAERARFDYGPPKVSERQYREGP